MDDTNRSQPHPDAKPAPGPLGPSQRVSTAILTAPNADSPARNVTFETKRRECQLRVIASRVRLNDR